jgi:hypothetical protein
LDSNPTNNFWYKLDVEWISVENKARARSTKQGQTSGQWTQWHPGANSTATAGIDEIRLVTDSGSNETVKYFDTIVFNGGWTFSIGNNGTWRDTYGTKQLWNSIINIPYGEQPFFNIDDLVEFFIIVRSGGITVAPGPNYTTDNTSLSLINDANPHLPNPMRQILEAGFYLVDDENVLKEKRFYFGQAHNLKD